MKYFFLILSFVLFTQPKRHFRVNNEVIAMREKEKENRIKRRKMIDDATDLSKSKNCNEMGDI